MEFSQLGNYIKDFVFFNKYGWFTGIGTQLLTVPISFFLGKYFGKKEIIQYINKKMQIDYNKRVILTIGASGTFYTAPNNGLFQLVAAGRTEIFVDKTLIQTVTEGTTTFKVLKGQTCYFVFSKPIKELCFYYEKA